MKKLEAIINGIDKPSILDVATGGGGFIHLIQSICPKYSKIVGVDSNDQALEAARKRFDDEFISFHKMDALNMTFSEASFDIVTLSNSLHHLKDIKAVIQEMEKVLKPGGFLIINEMYSDVDSEKRKTHVMMHHFWAEIDRLNDIVHHKTMKRQEIIEKLCDTTTLSMIEAWDMNYQEDHSVELSEEDYLYLENTLEQSLKRIPEDVDSEQYRYMAEQLKIRLHDIGFDSANQLLVVFKKN